MQAACAAHRAASTGGGRPAPGHWEGAPGEAAHREGPSTFTERVARYDLEGAAADAADGEIAVRLVVGPTARAAQSEHVVRESGKVEGLVDRGRSDRADALVTGCGD